MVPAPGTEVPQYDSLFFAHLVTGQASALPLLCPRSRSQEEHLTQAQTQLAQRGTLRGVPETPCQHAMELGWAGSQCTSAPRTGQVAAQLAVAARLALLACPPASFAVNLACFLSSRGGSPLFDRPGDRTRPSPLPPPLEAIGPQWVGFEIGELASILGAALLWAVNSAAAAAPLCCNDTTTDRPKPAQAVVQRHALA